MQGIDEAIKSDVVEALSRDSRVNLARITVDIDDGHVSLSGDAPTLYAIQAAVQLVSCVPGIRSISNRLVVDKSVRCSPDAAIQRCAEQMLGWNVSLNIAKLSVTVEQGVVVLRGEVSAYWKRNRAESLLCDLQGVVSVVNELAVIPELAPHDRVIADDVRMAIERCDCAAKDRIAVQVDQGLVILSGEVPSLWSKQNTQQLAESILGVKGVVDNLVVARQE
jgi:osmotically-inducible protein OsmY